jgi:3'-5' exonuclease
LKRQIGEMYFAAYNSLLAITKIGKSYQSNRKTCNMLNEIDIQNILFLDIETVPQHSTYTELSSEMQALWDKKSSYFRTEGQLAEEVYQRAGIYAEFGKIICISVGIAKMDKQALKLRLKSFAGDDEKLVLSGFGEMLTTYSGKRNIYLCAHNGKEFDYPFIARRMLINGIAMPSLLDNAGKKPWEIQHLDTMELWKFGDYKHYTSLNLLTAIFNIPSSKNDMDGSMVADVYWKENNLNRIIEYCQNDVKAVAQIMCRYKGLELIEEKDIEIVSNE